MTGHRRSINVPGLAHGSQPVPVASRVGDVVATGGVFGADPRHGDLPDDPDQQVRNVFTNIRRVLAAADADVSDIVKITVYVSDRALRGTINEEWGQMFPDPDDRPARHVLVHDLPGRIRVQCDVLAVVSNRPRPAGAA